MGWLAAARTLPVLLLGLVAGTWVDRLPRRPLLIATDLARAALLCSIPAAALLGQLRLDLLYAVAFLAGVLALVSQVAHASYLPALVGRGQLVEGNSKLAVTGQVASVAGPSLGGALVQLVTAPMAILADAISFVASAVLLGTIHRRESPPDAPAARRTLWREIGEGLRFVVGHPVLRTLTGAWGLYFLSDALFWGLYPLYVTSELGVSPAGLGLLFAVGSVGGVVGALFVEPLTRRLGLGPVLAGALLVGALGELCIPLAGGPLLVAMAVLALGEVLVRSSDWVFEVNFAALRQAQTPARLQGRVNATVRVLTSGVVPLGAFAGGLLGAAIGFRATVLVGVAGVMVAFLWVLLSPVRALPAVTAPAARPSSSSAPPGSVQEED
jgi:Na+/melibiose symporter-like transporter